MVAVAGAAQHQCHAHGHGAEPYSPVLSKHCCRVRLFTVVMHEAFQSSPVPLAQTVYKEVSACEKRLCESATTCASIGPPDPTALSMPAVTSVTSRASETASYVATLPISSGNAAMNAAWPPGGSGVGGTEGCKHASRMRLNSAASWSLQLADRMHALDGLCCGASGRAEAGFMQSVLVHERHDQRGTRAGQNLQDWLTFDNLLT